MSAPVDRGRTLRGVRALRDDGGYTLVELCVAMVLTSVVLAMVGTFYVNIAKLTTSAKVSRDGMGQSVLAIDAVRNVVSMSSDNPTSESATTPAVTSGSSSSVSVISYANTVPSAIAPSLVTFTLDASGYLTETRQAGTVASTGYWTFTGTTTVTRRVAGPFITAGGTPFFSYLDSTGTALASSSGLSSGDLGKVAFVRVTPKVAATAISGASDPVVISTAIGLTNVYRSVGAGVSLPGLSGGN